MLSPAAVVVMPYRHRSPRPPLILFVESIWVYQNDPRPHVLERILPTGAAQLIVNLKEDQRPQKANPKTSRTDTETPESSIGTASRGGSAPRSSRKRMQ